MQKTQFNLTLFDDRSVREKLTVMTKLEAMFDDERNKIPEEYYDIVSSIKYGQSIKLTVEII